MLGKKSLLLISIVALSTIPIFTTDVFGHGNPGVDRAPVIDFDNRNVTVEARMNPSDMTVGDFSNAYMTIVFLDDDTQEAFKQSTYKVDIYKQDKLLARNQFYAEEGKVTIDIRPNDRCSIEEEEPWKCTKYYGTEHSVTGGLYTFGQSNPVIHGPVFTEGGLYHINVEIIGAGSIHSSLLEPLSFDLYVTIAQEFTFYITVPDHLIIKDID